MQNLERLYLDELHHQVEAFDSPKLRRAVETITHLSQSEAQEYETL